jgi:hypothetical protein
VGESEIKKEETAEQPQQEQKPLGTKSIVLITMPVAIIILLCAFIYYDRTVTQPVVVMDGAVKSLRMLGSAELAYQAANNRKGFGAFKTLQKHGDIAENATEENIVSNYYVVWNVQFDEDFTAAMGGGDSMPWPPDAFTIIAYPVEPRRLKTFAITEDQDVLVYDPSKSNDPNAVHTWEVEQEWVWPKYPN